MKRCEMKVIKLIECNFNNKYYSFDKYVEEHGSFDIPNKNFSTFSFRTAKMLVSNPIFDNYSNHYINYHIIEYEKIEDLLELLKRLGLNYRRIFADAKDVIEKIEDSFPELMI